MCFLLPRRRTLRHTPARVTKMQTQTEKSLHCYHEAWEAVLHRREAQAGSEQAASLSWRKGVVDETVRKLKGKATDIVLCEICEERAAQCLLAGKNFFDEGIGIREMLSSYGIKIPKGKR